jgi:hypothetical protein
MKKEFTVEGIETRNPNQFGGMVSRAISLKAAVKDFDNGIETIATTDAPAEVIDWERWQVVREILPMRYMEAPNNDKVPLLDSHSRGSVEKIKGSASNFRTKGGQLLCKAFISKSEPVVREKISEGHIDSVSIGYITDKDYTVEIPKGASVNIDGVMYKNEHSDGVPLVVRTWWRVHELSLVPIGADETAKFKNAADYENKHLLDMVNELVKEIEAIKAKDKPDETGVERGLTYHEAQVRLLNYL